MTNLNKELIRMNILKLLDYSGLTDVSFANLLDVSDKTIKRIRKGEAQFDIDAINIACDFFKRSFASINNKEIEVDRLYRDKLISQHKGNPEFSVILSNQPSITYAINFELLPNKKFRTKGLSIAEIQKLFEARGWEFSSSYISTAMAWNEDKITRIPHPEREGWFLYRGR